MLIPLRKAIPNEPILTGAIEKWLGERYVEDVERAKKLLGRQVKDEKNGLTGKVIVLTWNLVSEDGPSIVATVKQYTGCVETDVSRLCELGDVLQKRATQEPFKGILAKSLPVDPTPAQVRAAQQPEPEQEKKVRSSLKDSWVRVIDGTRFGYYLALASVVEDDVANDKIKVKFALDGRIIEGLKASEVKVVQ